MTGMAQGSLLILLSVLSWSQAAVGKTIDGYLPRFKKPVETVVLGAAHALALYTDGTITQWGATATPPPKGLRKVERIYAGGDNSAVLFSNKTVIAWGPAVVRGDIKLAKAQSISIDIFPPAVAIADSGAVLVDSKERIKGYGTCKQVPATLASETVMYVLASGKWCWVITTQNKLFVWGPGSRPGQMKLSFDVYRGWATNLGYIFVEASDGYYYAISHEGVLRRLTELQGLHEDNHFTSFASVANGTYYANLQTDDSAWRLITGNVNNPKQKLVIGRDDLGVSISCGRRYCIRESIDVKYVSLQSDTYKVRLRAWGKIDVVV